MASIDRILQIFKHSSPVQSLGLHTAVMVDGGSIIYEMTDALYEELANLPPESALQLVSKWLKQNNLARVADTLTAEVSEDPSKWTSSVNSSALSSLKVGRSHGAKRFMHFLSAERRRGPSTVPHHPSLRAYSGPHTALYQNSCRGKGERGGKEGGGSLKGARNLRLNPPIRAWRVRRLR